MYNHAILTGRHIVNISSSLCTFSLCSTSGPHSTFRRGSHAACLLLLSTANSIGSSPEWSMWLWEMNTFLGNLFSAATWKRNVLAASKILHVPFKALLFFFQRSVHWSESSQVFQHLDNSMRKWKANHPSLRESVCQMQVTLMQTWALNSFS